MHDPALQSVKDLLHLLLQKQASLHARRGLLQEQVYFLSGPLVGSLIAVGTVLAELLLLQIQIHRLVLDARPLSTETHFIFVIGFDFC